MLNTYKSNGIFACVIDSYNPYHAVEKLWGEELRQEVIDSGATVVLRPDSGDPVEVNVKIIQILADKFGTTANLKGFKVLKHVRLIQGDGVNYDTIKNILDAFVKLGFSADNIAFGMGGALLQGMDRDTQQWAMKCSAMQINGQWNDVLKTHLQTLASSQNVDGCNWLKLVMVDTKQSKKVRHRYLMN